MKHLVLWLTLISLVLSGCGATSSASAPTPTRQVGTILVELMYLNHPPVRRVVAEVDEVLAPLLDRVQVVRYDADTPQGAAFAEAHGLTGHTPLAIFINGSMEATLDGRPIKFYSFPAGESPGMVADGGWTMADLQAVLAQLLEQP